MTLSRDQKLASFAELLSADTNGNITGVTLPSAVITGANADLGNIGNVKIRGGSSGQAMLTDGTGNLYFGTVEIDVVVSPAGSNTELQYNNNGNIAGAAGVLYNNTTGVLDVNQLRISGELINASTANLGAASQVKIFGGLDGQQLTTDGTGNLYWAPATTGTVTDVAGVGSGLGFSLSGNVSTSGALILTTPDVNGLRTTLDIGTVANVYLNSNSQTFLDGTGVFSVPPGENNPNLVVNGNIVPYTDGNLTLRDSTYPLNQINFRAVGGNVEAYIDEYANIETAGRITGGQISVEDISNATSVTFRASNTAVVNQMYNMPDNYPTANNQVLTATIQLGGQSFLSWQDASSLTGNLYTQPQIDFVASSTGNGQSFVDGNLNTFQSAEYALVYVNGVLQAVSEYTIVDNTLTFTGRINTGDMITVGPTYTSDAPVTAVPQFSFIAPVSGTNQQFISSLLVNYPDATYTTLFVDGVQQNVIDYTIIGDKLTFLSYLNAGDTITIAPGISSTGGGGGGGVVSVGGEGSGLGFELSGIVVGAGNLLLTTPTATQLKTSLSLGNVAELSLNGNVDNYLTGTGVWASLPTATVYTAGYGLNLSNNEFSLSVPGNSQVWLRGDGLWSNIALPATGNIANINLNGNSFTYLNGQGNWSNIAVPTGNIANINLTGGSSDYLIGNGSWQTLSFGNAIGLNYNGNNQTYLDGTGSWASISVPTGNIGNINLNGNNQTYLTGAGNWTTISAANTGNIAVLNLNGNGLSGLRGDGTWQPVPTGNIANTNFNGNSSTFLNGSGNWTEMTPPTYGNIVAINLNGNIQQSLRGDGSWQPVPTGNIGNTNFNGNGLTVLGGDGTWRSAGGAPDEQPMITFVSSSTAGPNQQFVAANLTNFTSNLYCQVYVNGVLQDPADYTLVGNTLTISRYLMAYSSVIVGPLSGFTGSAASVAGGNTQIQFNDGGTFGASANITFNKSTNTLNTKNIRTAALNVNGSGIPAPNTPSDPGVLGDVRFDGNYVYYCRGTNDWVRASMAPW